MPPRAKKRASIFPAYEPPSDGPPSAEYLASYFDRLAQRVLTYGAVLVFVAGAGGFLGIRIISPRDTSTTTEARFKALEDTVGAYGKRITNAEIVGVNNLYISCKILARIQPGSIPPKECSR
jgi:hypothetical protein